MLKILLIDDECVVLKGMQYILNKFNNLCEIVGTTEGSIEGLKKIEELQPDVVITDVKMPDIDGIELTRLAMEKHPNLYIIILSGHAEFEFARDALRYGAYDYLLKPCKHKVISDLLSKIETELVNKKINGLMQRELEKNLENRNKEIERRKILDIILGKNQDYNLNIPTDNIRVVLIKYKSKCMDKEMVTSIITEAIGEKVDLKYIVELLNYKNQYIIILKGNYDLKYIKNQLYFIKLSLIKQGALVWGGISNIYDGITGLQEAYRESSNIIEYLRFNDILEIREMSEIKKQYINKQNEINKMIFDEDYIIKKLFLGEVKILEEELNANIEKIVHSNEIYDPKIVRTQVKQLMILIEKRLREKNISLEKIFGHSVECIFEIERINNYRNLFDWCKNMLITICCYIKENKKHLPKAIQQVLDYIDMNYEKDISMKQMADYVYLNPWYFSEMFKEKMGIRFSDYLTRVRINKAKELLLHTNLKNYEIAERIGFKNSTYFNVVFKRVEGMTPKLFRESI